MIKELKELLGSKPKRMKLMKAELSEIAKKYGDERRTEIISDDGEFTVEDLIADEVRVRPERQRVGRDERLAGEIGWAGSRSRPG